MLSTIFLVPTAPPVTIPATTTPDIIFCATDSPAIFATTPPVAVVAAVPATAVPEAAAAPAAELLIAERTAAEPPPAVNDSPVTFAELLSAQITSGIGAIP